MTTLFVSDLDGTLLGIDGRLSPTSSAALRRTLDRGVRFTVASARSVVSMRDVLGPVPLRLPVVCANGAYVCDFATDAYHDVVRILDEVARAIHGAARAHGVHAMVSTWHDQELVYVPDAHDEGVAFYVESLRAHNDPRVRLVPDTGMALDQAVTGLTAIDRPAALAPLAAELQAAWGPAIQLHLVDDFYLPGWAWLTIHAAEANKGHAVRGVMAAHTPEADRLVVFGDQANDLPMFARADYAVATGNADPAVKDAADEVIGLHHEDAVVAWLEHHSR